LVRKEGDAFSEHDVNEIDDVCCGMKAQEIEDIETNKNIMFFADEE